MGFCLAMATMVFPASFDSSCPTSRDDMALRVSRSASWAFKGTLALGGVFGGARTYHYWGMLPNQLRLGWGNYLACCIASPFHESVPLLHVSSVVQIRGIIA